MSSTISMDGLRKQMANNYNKVVSRLNRNADKKEGVVKIDMQSLSEPLDDLRMSIGFLLCTFDKNDSDYNDLHDIKLIEFDYDEE